MNHPFIDLLASDRPDSATDVARAASIAAITALTQMPGMSLSDAQAYVARVLAAAIPIVGRGYRAEADAAIADAMAGARAEFQGLLDIELAGLRHQLVAAERERDRLKGIVEAFDSSAISAVKGLHIRFDEGDLRLATDERLASDMLQGLIDWCAANNIDAAKVPGQSSLRIIEDTIEFEECQEVTAADGTKSINSGLPRRQRTVPLIVPIPDEWIRRPRE